MAEGRDIPIVEQEKKVGKRPPWWKRLWGWTEFGKKSGWDWLQLLIVPLALAVIGFWFTAQQDARQQQIENQRAQDTALQAYLDQMNQLLPEYDLRNSKEDSEVRILARARTLSVLRMMDPDRRTDVMEFLIEAFLVQGTEGKEPVVSLRGATLADAELSGANLSHADLEDANLTGADLSYADLEGAFLPGANLRGANLSDTDLSDTYMNSANLRDAQLWNANLSGASLRYAYFLDANLSEANLSGVVGITNEELEQEAKSLRDTTMPDGSTHD